MSVYRVTEVIGTSPTSWEDAAKAALWAAARTLRDLRIAEVVEQDIVVGDAGTWSPGWLVFAALGSFVFGGGIGFVIGQIVGLTLALIATAAPARSRLAIVRVAVGVGKGERRDCGAQHVHRQRRGGGRHRVDLPGFY